MAKAIPLFTTPTDPVSKQPFVELTIEGQGVAVQLANIFKASMPDPAWVTQNETTAWAKVLNYRSPNTGKRLKDVYSEVTLGDKTIAIALASATVELLSMKPISLANDPLAGL